KNVGEAGGACIGVLDLLIKATSGLVMLSLFLNLLHQQIQLLLCHQILQQI
ncbi:hypothetical protein S245_057570, partial [Arachis hypogaea]